VATTVVVDGIVVDGIVVDGIVVEVDVVVTGGAVVVVVTTSDCADQLIPSVDVATRFPVPVFATATKVPLPYVTDSQELAGIPDPSVHVDPLVEYAARVFEPLCATATNLLLPKVIEFQPFTTAFPPVEVKEVPFVETDPEDWLLS
jgi:hypothetical protein